MIVKIKISTKIFSTICTQLISTMKDNYLIRRIKERIVSYNFVTDTKPTLSIISDTDWRAAKTKHIKTNDLFSYVLISVMPHYILHSKLFFRFLSLSLFLFYFHSFFHSLSPEYHICTSIMFRVFHAQLIEFK